MRVAGNRFCPSKRAFASKAFGGCVAVSLLSGCIVDDPAVYDEQTRTVPVIDLDGISPRTTELLVISEREVAREFSVPIRSRDYNELVFGYLHLNYGLSGAERVDFNALQPSNDFSETRTLKLRWTPGLRTGCQQLTVIVGHESNFDTNASLGIPIDPSLTTRATWWANVVDPQSGEDPYDLIDCPNNLAP